jgi:hypothetical protein
MLVALIMFIKEYMFAVVTVPRYVDIFCLDIFQRIIWLFDIWSSQCKGAVTTLSWIVYLN